MKAVNGAMGIVVRALALAVALFGVSATDALAQTALFSGRPVPPTFDITKNIQTDYGAACVGDYQSRTLTVSITSGTKLLTVFSNSFTGADVGKKIFVYGADSPFLNTSISAVGAFSAGQQVVTVSDNAISTLTSSAQTVVSGTDDAPAFIAFNTFARTQGASRILLNWPNTPSTCQLLDPLSAASKFADGVQNLTVDLQSGKLSAPFPDGAIYFLGAFAPLCQKGLTDAGGCSARINSVSAGATSVTLTPASLAAGYAARFTVGNYALITGFDDQGFGFPVNPYFYEYVIVTGVNAGTGVITFAAQPLVNGYLSTWPQYNTGTAFEADQGGPATIYGLTSAFNTTVEYRNGTLYQSVQQTTALGVSATFRNITIQPTGTGVRTACPYPSRNIRWSVFASDFSFCQIEMDKTVDQVVFNGSSVYIMEHQSASPNLLTTTNVTFGSGMTGTPKNWFDTGSTIPAILAGTEFSGHTTEINLTNTSFGSLVDNGYLYAGGAGDPGANTWPMSSGVITIPNTQDPQPWAVPGTNLFWSGSAYLGSFRVTGVTQDATNIYVQTSLPGTYPAFNSSLLIGGTKLNLRTHPAPKFTCTGCTGSVQAANLNSAPAGAPLFSYYRETFDGGGTGPWPPNSGSQVGFPVIGNFVSASYNVTKAYTGVAGTLSFSATGQFLYTTVVPSTLTSFNYDPFVNLKATAPRTMTTSCSGPSTCSTTGNVAGDTPTTPAENVWMGGTISPFISANISGESSSLWPSVTVTITADQGVVLP